MVTEIRNNLFLIKIPMPNASLDHINSYIIKNDAQCLIVDTGFDHPMCMAALENGLKELGLDLSNAEIFITHLHGDHFGLAPALAPSVKRVYISRPEVELLRQWRGWQPLADFARRHGFPAAAIAETLEHLPYHHMRLEAVANQVLVDDGTALEIGGYRFTSVLTSGHSYGHMCLYAPEHRILIAGDHILNNITPSLQCWSETRNSLQAYLKSLDRVRELDVELVLPGHQDLIRNYHRRISQIKTHHDARCREILTMLEWSAMPVYQIAAGMTWDIDRDHWDDFPMVQKWFAFGEAMAHVKYLESRNFVHRSQQMDHVTFSVNQEMAARPIIP
jgi:glyoxylase-like metal-dependent hydrolase (beta-lactamase superfamily II)